MDIIAYTTHERSSFECNLNLIGGKYSPIFDEKWTRQFNSNKFSAEQCEDALTLSLKKTLRYVTQLREIASFNVYFKNYIDRNCIIPSKYRRKEYLEYKRNAI